MRQVRVRSRMKFGNIFQRFQSLACFAFTEILTESVKVECLVCVKFDKGIPTESNWTDSRRFEKVGIEEMLGEQRNLISSTLKISTLPGTTYVRSSLPPIADSV